MNKILEIACYNIESAIMAAKSGAGRIEFCDNFYEGGTTPSYGSVKKLTQKVNIPVNVIIRPRGGDFLYTDAEYEVIKEDVKAMKKIGVNGVVVGFLKKDGSINADRTKEIVALAEPLEVTFHRAFDVSNNLLKSLEILKQTGVKRILTSGGMKNAEAGAGVIKMLVNNAADKIIIMAGGGIRDKNLLNIINITGAAEYHSSALKLVKSEMEFFPSGVKMGGDDFDETKKVSVNQKMINVMSQIIRG